MVKEIKSEEDFNQAINDKNFKATIVDFTATWCGPCQMIKPKFEEFSKQYTNVLFIKVDVDELSDLSGAQGVRAMPSFYVYQNGQKVDELVGANVDKLENLIKKYN